MKLALIIALSPDRRSGRVLSDILPADQAIDKVKRAITDGACPDARFPIIRAISLDAKLREHRFRVTAEDIAEDTPSTELSGSAFLGDLIPVEIGKGEQLVVINVTTEDEAKFLREIAIITEKNHDEIIRIQKAMADEMAAHQTSMAAAQKELADCRDTFVKHEGLVSGANDQIEKLLAEKTAAASQAAKFVEAATERDQRIKDLEAQLAEAVKAKKPAK